MQTNSTDKAAQLLNLQVLRFCSLASGIMAVLGLIFIVIFYSGIGIFGPLNDVAYTLQLIFTLPIMIYISTRVDPPSPISRRMLLITGSIGFLGAISLQLLLIIGVLSFFQMIGFLLAFVAVITVWFVLIERWRGTEASIPRGLILAILAGMTFGYPLWAYRFQRDLGRVETKMTSPVQGGD